jgi:Exo-beta-D-glucosaminidase Ig-fold domain
VNTTTTPLQGVAITANVVALDNAPLAHREEHKDLAADAVTNGFPLEMKSVPSAGVVLVKLELHDAAGKLLSRNLYWIGEDSSSYRALERIPLGEVEATAVSVRNGETVSTRVSMQNRSKVPLLQIKLTLVNVNNGSRILPAYYDDNYLSLLPGESREVEIESATNDAQGPARIALRGWNLASKTVPVSATK